MCEREIVLNQIVKMQVTPEHVAALGKAPAPGDAGGAEAVADAQPQPGSGGAT